MLQRLVKGMVVYSLWFSRCLWIASVIPSTMKLSGSVISWRNFSSASPSVLTKFMRFEPYDFACEGFGSERSNRIAASSGFATPRWIFHDGENFLLPLFGVAVLLDQLVEARLHVAQLRRVFFLRAVGLEVASISFRSAAVSLSTCVINRNEFRDHRLPGIFP